MGKAISNRKLYPALAGAVLAAISCGVALKLVQTSSQPDSEEVAQAPAQDAPAEAFAPLTPFESGPFLQASPGLRLADPALLRSTSPNARVDVVVAGRSDPFAPIVRPSAGAARPRPTTQQAVTTPPSQVSPVQTLPVVPVASTQPLPPLPSLSTPAVPGSTPQTNQEVAVAPAVNPVQQSPIDQIAITGVAQIGNAVSVIVRESTGASSRHVKVGDMLAGGQVRVKSIDTSSAEPVVVLTYNGQDYTRTVGSGTLIGSL